MAALLTAFAAGGHAGEKIAVDVYLSDRDDSVLLVGPGKVLASGLFDQIGIRLVWHDEEQPLTKRDRPGRPAVAIHTLEHSSALAGSEALASTRIGNVAEILIYKDRLKAFLIDQRNLSGAAVGYILAHELAHAMQGIARHSESGILKAKWSRADYREMVFHRLAFAPEDVNRIHRGLALQQAARQAEFTASFVAKR